MHAAVFVDFENLFLSLKNREELSGQRIRDLCLGILEHLKARLQADKAPMVLGRSYAAFDTYPGMEVAHDLALMGFDPQYVLTGHGGKNSADVQLACDVCRVLYRRPDIDAVVIVSGDRDFIPIARQVLEENRELRVVAIPDNTSGDLRMRVGGERFWNALELIGHEPRDKAKAAPAEPAAEPPIGPPAPPASAGHAHAGSAPGGAPGSAPGSGAGMVPGGGSIAGVGVGHGNGHGAASPPRPRAAIVGHIPVTWRTVDELPQDGELVERLTQCVELILRAQSRHGSEEVWLSPFLKGAMSQHFSGLVHPERRALVNELRHRGVIRIEERANQYADHPYSVIVLDAAHPMVVPARERLRRREEAK
ncbi:MAG: NYN domain-containing protein [Planctomycetes bacterium]|nr:NYN domain-containing protein [Planctomycetota bacterium]